MKTLSKAIKSRISEVVDMASNVDQFYCDFNSTIESCMWDLQIAVNKRNVTIKHDGTMSSKMVFWISREDDIAELKWYLSQFRKSLKKELS